MATFDEFRRSTLTLVKPSWASGSRFSASGSLRMILSGPRRLNINQSSIDTTGKQALGDIVDVLFRNAYVASHKVCLTLSNHPQNVSIG